MYVIGNRRTVQGLTSCVDRHRADRIAFGFEQYAQRGAIRDDLGARDHYWHVGRPSWGWPHPYDLEARTMLEAERDALMAAYRRNTQCRGVTAD
jgi:hypothetical protein